MTILQYFDFNDKTFLNNSSTKKYLKFKSKIVVKHILNQFKLKFENKTKIWLQKIFCNVLALKKEDHKNIRTKIKAIVEF